ncbi:MAG TPA: class IV adenylate cyclase [bacterium]|nr:class IV adenylate cyclase [bacterium]
MYEVEIRAKVDNLKLISEKLTKLGAVLTNQESQVDRVFGHPDSLDSNHQIIEGGLSARIRENNDSTRVEFKEIVREKGSGLEISAKVSDPLSAQRFLSKLGFEEAFTVEKIRKNYKLKDFEIALDKVKKLGDFIEIEHACKTGENSEATLKQCIEMLKEIDPLVKLEKRKYGDLMQELINSNKNA